MNRNNDKYVKHIDKEEVYRNAVEIMYDYMKRGMCADDVPVLENILKEAEDTQHCCFCGKPVIYHYNGNDPRPIKVNGVKNPICCDTCNNKFVIPTRMEVWFNESKKETEL